MKLFNTLLEIKIGKKDLPTRAVFIENALYGWWWTYFIYHYDSVNNIYYINDLDYEWTENRVSALNIIEQIIIKAYKQEMNSLHEILKIIHKNNKPKVYCFYRQRTRLIVLDKINLKAIKWKKWNIIWFQNTKWNINDSNKTKVKKLKSNLLDFYSKKHIE